jgi:hypothetical protein
MSGDCRIRSFKPFAGALLLAVAIRTEYSLFKRARSHPPEIGCCPLHAAATLPGGEDAQWILDYTNSPSFSFSNDRAPAIGVDSRIDMWTEWESYTERIERFASSISSGDIYALDRARFTFQMLRGDDLPEEQNVIIASHEQCSKLNTMSLDQLECLAARGSEITTKMLVLKLARSGEEARFVFWAFIYCSVHKGSIANLFGNMPVLETKIGEFQLGKCFAEAKEFGGEWFDNNYACTIICFNNSVVNFVSLHEKISYYIDGYRNAQERAKRAINLWSCGMVKQGLIYDVRHIIVKLLWDARWTWISRWESGIKVKKLKALYSQAGTGHAPLPGVN